MVTHLNKSATFGLIVLIFLMTASACAIKSDPLPGDRFLPGRVSAPEYGFTKEGLLKVTFRPPTRTVDGTPLKDLGGFYIDCSENELTPSFCAECPVEYERRIKIKADKPPARLKVLDRPYTFEDRLKPGHVYYYRILAHDSGGEYDPARFRVLRIYYDTPCVEPAELSARTDDRLVHLDWRPPSQLSDARPVSGLAGYDVFRRSSGGEYVRLNKNGPVPEEYFRDEAVANSREYEYQVSAVRDVRGTLVPGPPTGPVRATPVDLTPPPPPVKVWGASFNEGVKLAWPMVETADLAGYRVYRASSRQGPFKRIGPELVPENLFVDEKVTPGASYFYRVSSVDSSPAPNEGEPGPIVSIRHVP